MSVALPILIFAVTLISLLLVIAEAFGLSPTQTSTLILTCYGVSGVVSLGMTAFYRQPLFLIWQSQSLIVMASLADRHTYAEMLGATLVAGIVVVGIGVFGLSTWLARLVPPGIVFGIQAGLILPFVVRVFSDLRTSPLVLGATVSVFVLGRRVLPASLPPLLPAIVAGVVMAAVVGDVTGFDAAVAAPTITATSPELSWKTILTVSPVVVVLIVPLSNLTAGAILREFDYDPPRRSIDVVCGIATVCSSFFAPVPVSLGSFVTALTAGPEAGPPHRRHWSVYVTSGSLLAVGLAAGIAAAIPAAVPSALLFGVAGLALVTTLAHALTEVTRGPLRLGPLFAFAVASSDLSLGGFGPAFWALIIGLSVTLLVEADAWRLLRPPGAGP